MRFGIIIALFASSPALASGFTPSPDDLLVQKGRAMIAQERPDIVKHMARQDGFGGPKSALIARAMLSTAPEVVAEARAKMTIEPHGKGMWLIRFPYVNVALIETRDSLVLFDSGYASIGVVLKDVVPTLSKKPLKTIFLSHTHVDHSYGARELVKLPSRPRVIASAQMLKAIDTDLRLGGSIGRYNNQPLSLQPSTKADVVVPDETFEGRKTYKIGGETFVVTHAPGETEDQIWLSSPGRKTIVTADYYQGFLPNAGNGKRMQRYVEEWTAAYREMAALDPRSCCRCTAPPWRVRTRLARHSPPMPMRSITSRSKSSPASTRASARTSSPPPSTGPNGSRKTRCSTHSITGRRTLRA